MQNKNINLIKYSFRTRRAWWFSATARTRARFSRTIIGSFWLGLANLIFALILGSVYGIVFNAQSPREYFIYLGLGFTIWSTIGSSIIASPQIFEVNAHNIKNSTIHPIFYLLEEWAFQIQTFIQSFLFIVIFLSFLSPNILINLIIYAPLHILNLFLFILWLPLLFCLAAIRYQDLYQLIPILTQLTFLLSPIFYNEKNLGELDFVAKYNPIYQVLALLRNSILESKLMLKESLLLLMINLFMIWVTFKLLQKRKKDLLFYI